MDYPLVKTVIKFINNKKAFENLSRPSIESKLWETRFTLKLIFGLKTTKKRDGLWNINTIFNQLQNMESKD